MEKSFSIPVTYKGVDMEFEARLRIDTPKELDYYQHGGILQYVLRQLLTTSKAA